MPNNGGGDDLDAGAGEDLFISNAVCDGDQLDGGPDRDNANWANFGIGDLDRHGGRRSPGWSGGGGEPSCPSGDPAPRCRDRGHRGDEPGRHHGRRPRCPTSFWADRAPTTTTPRPATTRSSPTPGPPATTPTRRSTAATASTPLRSIGRRTDPTPPRPIARSSKSATPNSFRPPDTPPGTPDTSIETKPPPPLPPPPVDSTRPQTRLASGMPKRVRAGRDGRRRVVFRFSSNERGARFVCRLDRRRATRCASPRAYTVAIGRHAFRVTAIDAAGNTDSSPALFRFRVRP